MPKQLSHRFCVAPMMEWTDRHDRFFLRLITRRALLYTEMITTGALIHGERERFLDYDSAEHPVALQLGGSEPAALADCAAMAEDAGFDEVNLNVGCPSDRVRSGRFGACLMAEPDLVARSVEAMRARVSLPVTVKCRIGIDDQDPSESLPGFVQSLRDAGCETVIVHARMAWLDGFSPRQNREVPPLRYDLVHDLKRSVPDLEVVLNGGLADLDQAAAHVAVLDGVMLGRAVYQTPYLLADVDRRFFGDDRPPRSRAEVIRAYLPYVSARLGEGASLHAMTRHILGLCHGLPGARAWRRHLSEAGRRRGAGVEVIEQAAALVDLDAPLKAA